MNEYRAVKAEFEQNVMLAKNEGIEWYETELDVIKNYITEEKFNKSQPPGYFLYKDVKITTPGRAAEIQEYLDTPILERINKDGGTVARGKSKIRVISKDAIETFEIG